MWKWFKFVKIAETQKEIVIRKRVFKFQVDGMIVLSFQRKEFMNIFSSMHFVNNILQPDCLFAVFKYCLSIKYVRTNYWITDCLIYVVMLFPDKSGVKPYIRAADRLSSIEFTRLIGSLVASYV